MASTPCSRTGRVLLAVGGLLLRGSALLGGRLLRRLLGGSLLGLDDGVRVCGGVGDLLRFFDDLFRGVGGLLALDGDEAGQIDGLAVGVDDGDLAERDRESLVAGDLTDHGGQLVALLQRVDEVLRSMPY